MKWSDALTNADLDMTLHAKHKGKAILKVYYYGQKNGTVRKIISPLPHDEQEFFEQVTEED